MSAQHQLSEEDLQDRLDGRENARKIREIG